MICDTCDSDIFECQCTVATRFVAGSDRLCDLLQTCLAKAQREIIISSPWITISAVRSIMPVMEAALARGVAIHVYTDAKLNLLSEADRRLLRKKGGNDMFRIHEDRFERAVRVFRSMKVRIHRLNDVHNKSLIVDRSLFVDGSFNWLSAQRGRSASFKRHDTAIVVSGRAACRHRMEFLNAQYSCNLRNEPILLNTSEADTYLNDFISLSEDRDEFRLYEEPSYSMPVTAQLYPKLFFSTLGESATTIEKSGLTQRVINMNHGSVALAPTIATALRFGEVRAKDEMLVENWRESAVFSIDMLSLPDTISIIGTFSRNNQHDDAHTILETSCPIPPQFLQRLDTIYVDESIAPEED